MEVPEAIRILSKEIHQENGKREELLRAKCRWEDMSRSFILIQYGDPAAWPDMSVCREEK